jgi:hypothetical protein
VAEKIVGDWQLVVEDEPGVERLRVTIADLGLDVRWLDFDGRWALVSAWTEDGEPVPPLVLDTLTHPLAGRVLDQTPGVATLSPRVSG